jgi:hypothetical protein
MADRCYRDQNLWRGFIPSIKTVTRVTMVTRITTVIRPTMVTSTIMVDLNHRPAVGSDSQFTTF